MYCNKSELFHEYSTILRTLDKINCNKQNDVMSSGDFVRKTSKTSFIKEDEPMKMIDAQEKRVDTNSEKSQIIEIYALMLSVVSFLLGFCLKIALSSLDFFANLSRTLTIMCIDDLWSGSNEPFLLTYDNFKALIIKTAMDFNGRKVLLLIGVWTTAIGYAISKLLFQIVKFLLVQVPVPK
ncbi:unnamed protein product [Chironomus riparius]|uniref:Uncharacterized protein n=1 Tax=Chironomus riparius TaxID=315576 RepID=A0A9N9WUN7_9DIPT|nr:unnamed protein product [Chironomus riparius]